MVYVKRIELSHFKSFGGTTPIPFLPGFTVISGPNGSGKSNILDALLFALGLSTSKGMRAERLPDLVNQTHSSRARTSEASVTVTLALDDNPATEGADWTVMRRLRVTHQGTYTSTYTINGQTATLTELHEQLREIRIYPEGYNVVLQGDVTSIISMNAKERRQIIDEMAGVATFDRKIGQAREKLDTVKEHEERFRIVERELIDQRDRLAQDRIKAEKYQQLKATLQTKSQWEQVLQWQTLQTQTQALAHQLQTDHQTLATLHHQLQAGEGAIAATTATLHHHSQQVKALGEEDLLQAQALLARQEAEQRQLQRQLQTLQTQAQSLDQQLQQTQTQLQDLGQTLQTLQAEHTTAQANERLQHLTARDQAHQALEQAREAMATVAAAADAAVQEQAQLHHTIETLVQTLQPLRAEEAQLQERLLQLRQQWATQTDQDQTLTQAIAQNRQEWTTLHQAHQASQAQVAHLTQTVAIAQAERQLQQETEARLLREQRDKQRHLDQLEAKIQALQESQGTQATQLILQTGLPGVHGIVAQLGEVAPQYQLALEIAAGARLGNLVVEDDGVAAAGIRLLKEKRAGRATFLPLRQLRPPSYQPLPPWQRPQGMVDYAANLVTCEDRFQPVFAYVFGSTLVFTHLDLARPHLGKHRIITLDGELLETSGAMTGGSLQQRGTGLHFGNPTRQRSQEILDLEQRLQEIEPILRRCTQTITHLTSQLDQHHQALLDAKQQEREHQLQRHQLEIDHQRLQQQHQHLIDQRPQLLHHLDQTQARLQVLAQILPHQTAQLQAHRHHLASLEQSQAYHEWQQLQTTVRQRETQLQEHQTVLQTLDQHLQSLASQQQRLQEQIRQRQQHLQTLRQQQQTTFNQQTDLTQQITHLTQQITQTQTTLTTLEAHLRQARDERDRTERQLQEQRNQQQQLLWQQQKLQETQAERQQQLQALQDQLQTQAADLPTPLPDLPPDLNLEALQQELRSLQKRLQAMEPVNMLALEAHQQTQNRLDELSQKLATLDEERTELLLRIENFTTLRQRAFQESFDAVNENFRQIFAELSDGDGYLQLDDPTDPFQGGLNLVAHPKGKPVRRLASMSGGEKSLTALSFIFALQRYRPSPFYAFDEVDMFLDGANVERLAKMIQQQAQGAQFIVVSLRRPMIEAAERTVGVTQARGAHTQVIGLNLQPQRTSKGAS